MTKDLSPGGVLFIEVPCTDYKHKNVDEPHLLFFDKKSMHELLSRLSFSDIQLSYHGQGIEDLRSVPFITKAFRFARAKVISFGITAPFAAKRKGMEILPDPLERAVVAPFKAHTESAEPSWWLRALAIKK